MLFDDTQVLTSEASLLDSGKTQSSSSSGSIAASDSRCGLMAERFSLFCLLSSLKASQQTLDAFVRPLSSYICCWLLLPSNRLLMISKRVWTREFLFRFSKTPVRAKMLGFFFFFRFCEVYFTLFFSFCCLIRTRPVKEKNCEG